MSANTFSAIDSFSFEADGHVYTAASGERAQSATELLKKHRIIDYSRVPESILEPARQRGQILHEWTAEFDRNDNPDFLILPEEWCGYAHGYLKFRRESGLEVIAVERSLMAWMNGVLVAGTPDRRFRYKRVRDVNVDLKFCAAKQPSWKVQTAIYEFLETRTMRLGAMDRFSLQLFPDGKYNLEPYTDRDDGEVFKAILAVEAWRKNHRMKED
jgi:hypothetical protein